MIDPFDGVRLWASIFSIKSLLLVVTIASALLGPQIWQGRRWWLWILPRDWRAGAASADEATRRRWLFRVKVTFWLIFGIALISWILLTLQVKYRS
jgi:hypothetical protein